MVYAGIQILKNDVVLNFLFFLVNLTNTYRPFMIKGNVEMETTDKQQ